MTRIIGIIVFALVFLPILAESNGGRGMFSPPKFCGVKSETFLIELIKKDLPSINFFDVLVVAGNDLQCQEPEYMVNLVVVAVEGPGKYRYGIFNIHFSKHGKLISAAAINQWQITNNLDDPSITNKWCSFVKSVYPSDSFGQAFCK